MASLIGLSKIFARDESGQAFTEYILLLSIALGGAIAMSRGIMKILDSFTAFFGAELERDLKSGRIPTGVWRN